MSQTLCFESKLIIEDIYSLVELVDRSRYTFRREMEQVLRTKLSTIQSDLAELIRVYEKNQEDKKLKALRNRLYDLSNILDTTSFQVSSSAENVRLHWTQFRSSVLPVYEAIAAHLKTESIHVPSLRPTNYTRNLFHVACGVVALVCTQYLFSSQTMVFVAGSFALSAWTCEVLRKFNPKINKLLMQLFSPIAHPHEHYRVNSATWYTTALFVLSLLMPKMICTISVVVLAVGDPIAAFIGRKFGKHRISAGRSLEGCLSFVVFSGLMVLTVLRLYYPQLTWLQMSLLAFSGALSGSLAEILSKKIDDNFSIPLTVAVGTFLLSKFII